MKNRRKTVRKQTHFYFLRISGSISLLNTQEPPLNIHIILQDFSKKGIGIYTPVPFTLESKIILSIQSPQSLITEADIAWCKEANISHKIITTKPNYKYKIGIHFTPANEVQKKTIETFEQYLIEHRLIKETTQE